MCRFSSSIQFFFHIRSHKEWGTGRDKGVTAGEREVIARAVVAPIFAQRGSAKVRNRMERVPRQSSRNGTLPRVPTATLRQSTGVL